MSVIANRYVQALHKTSKSEEENTMLENSLKEIADLFNSNKEFKKVMLDPRIANEQKEEIIKEIFPKSNDIFINFITLLIKEKRINCIQDIAKEYAQINSNFNKELNIKIIVARTIEQEQIDAIVKKYKTMYKAEVVNYEIEIEPKILGGVKVVIGNKIYDGSVETQLKQMF